MTILRTPYLLFIGDAPDQLAAKTAAGVAFWRPEISRAQLRLPGCNADLGLPDMTIEEAAAAGVKTVIVGTTNRGGVLGEGWEGLLVRALELGMDLASTSPYNTYRHAGLPPGPIGNPGKESLGVALHPAETDYLYFVLRPNGSGAHNFSKSMEEHLAAAAYRRSRVFPVSASGARGIRVSAA